MLDLTMFTPLPIVWYQFSLARWYRYVYDHKVSVKVANKIKARVMMRAGINRSLTSSFKKQLE